VSANLLSGRGLTYHVAGRAVLDGVDVAARSGRVLAICGPSGAGKSSLVSLLGGLLAPTAGTVTLDGAPVQPGDAALRCRVAVVLQGYGLVSALTARENVAVTLQARGVSRHDVRLRTATALADVGLADVADHPIEDLSGGQQQRVAVARALAVRPDVLLADEPTSELDAENRERIMQLLTGPARPASIVVIASHDADVVARCDDAVELDAGAVVSTAQPGQPAPD
jgi:putative ABC transport system ATP-binding protein